MPFDVFDSSSGRKIGSVSQQEQDPFEGCSSVIVGFVIFLLIVWVFMGLTTGHWTFGS